MLNLKSWDQLKGEQQASVFKAKDKCCLALFLVGTAHVHYLVCFESMYISQDGFLSGKSSGTGLTPIMGM